MERRPLSVEISKEKGRGLFWRGVEQVQPGTVLLRTAPYACVLRHTYWDSLCYTCFEVPSHGRLKSCARCRCVLYCNEECQRKDWLFHREECQGLPLFLRTCNQLNASSEDISDIVLLARTLRALRLSDLTSHEERSVEDLLAENHGELIPTPVQLVKSMAVAICLQKDPSMVERLAQTKFLSPLITSKHDVYAWLSMLQCNKFGIADDRMVPVGEGVYSVSSLLNHSCRPNCLYTFDPVTHVQVCRSVTAIAPGEELLISYVDIVLPAAERHVLLFDLYGFSCSCTASVKGVEKCVQDTLQRYMRADRWGRRAPQLECLPLGVEYVSPGMTLDQIDSTDTFSMLKSEKNPPCVAINTLLMWLTVASKAFCEQPSSACFESVCRSLDVLRLLLHPLNVDLYSKRCEAFSLARERGHLRVAFEVGEDMTSFLEIVYKDIPCHPILGLHYCAMKEIYEELGLVKQSENYKRKAHTCLSIAYGPHHRIVAMLDMCDSSSRT